MQKLLDDYDFQTVLDIRYGTGQLSKEQFPYHIRHYIPEEFEQILQESGFTLVEWYTQHDSNSGVIHKGWDGKYNIAVCEKR